MYMHLQLQTLDTRQTALSLLMRFITTLQPVAEEPDDRSGQLDCKPFSHHRLNITT